MTMPADVGLIGLGVMGTNLALNLADNGHRVAVFNRTCEAVDRFAASEAAKGKEIHPYHKLSDFITGIKRPAQIIIMVKPGAAVDQIIRQLTPLLAKGDIIIDAGDSFFKDTIRRTAELASSGLGFVGLGVSGGGEDARRGLSLMPGGTPENYGRIEPILLSVAAKVLGKPCCAHIGPEGAGHFVKMIHNGIEYADMQLIAETYSILKDLVNLDYPAMSEALVDWNQGELEGYLLEITAEILARRDIETGQPICEIILDAAGQKDTGFWASREFLELGLAAPSLIEAVQARSLSVAREERTAARILPGPKAKFSGDSRAFAKEIGEALYAAKIICYAQGFHAMAAGAETYGWKLDLAALATIWRGGCIIRGRFLQRIADAYRENPCLPNLLLDKYLKNLLKKSQGAIRRVAAAAIGAGVPIPVMSSALAFYDGYRSDRLPANLIQAQRDYFGGRTCKHLDKGGYFHSEWTNGKIG
ncbi:MAG: NADP-dependent phosphogluconate dehydrogenase [Planctomycetes bacterium]|nr:NADP-dependent phosphogluconate dehydrogenase [Planctomycetota bacterium]